MNLSDLYAVLDQYTTFRKQAQHLSFFRSDLPVIRDLKDYASQLTQVHDQSVRSWRYGESTLMHANNVDYPNPALSLTDAYPWINILIEADQVRSKDDFKQFLNRSKNEVANNTVAILLFNTIIKHFFTMTQGQEPQLATLFYHLKEVHLFTKDNFSRISHHFSVIQDAWVLTALLDKVGTESMPWTEARFNAIMNSCASLGVRGVLDYIANEAKEPNILKDYEQWHPASESKANYGRSQFS